jgi:hypothetical protein
VEKETRSRLVTSHEGKKMKRGENKWCVFHHNRPDKERAKEN